MREARHDLILDSRDNKTSLDAQAAMSARGRGRSTVRMPARWAGALTVIAYHHFVLGSREWMGRFANDAFTAGLAWTMTACLIVLNGILLLL
jgi:hypothetical protein